MKNTTKSRQKAKKKGFVVSFRISDDAYKTIKQEADTNDRSISYVARQYLEGAVAQQR